MKLVITIDNGKVTVDYGDEQVAVVPPKPPFTKINANKTPEVTAPAAAPEMQISERKCEICGSPIPPFTHRLAKVCSAECREEKRRQYQNKSRKAKAPPEQDAHWCKKCQAYTTHDTANHPEEGVVVSKPAPLDPDPAFMPGHEKSKEEIDSWRPALRGKVSRPTTEGQRAWNNGGVKDQPRVVPQAEKLDPAFTDPWNCSMCRNAQSLCVLHEGLEKDGKRAPKF